MIKSYLKGVLLTTLCFLQLDVQGEWSVAQFISPGQSSIDSQSPLIIDSNSVATVAWLNGPDIGTSNTLSSSSLFPSATEWSAPIDVFQNSSVTAFPSPPVLFRDGMNQQEAGFGIINLSTSEFQINAVRRPGPSSPWSTPPISQLVTGGIPGGGGGASDLLGNLGVVLALSTTNSPPWALKLLQLREGSSAWETPIDLDTDASPQPAITLKMVQGEGVIVWKTNIPSLQLKALRYNFQTGASAPTNNVPLPPGVIDIVDVKLAMNCRKDAILIFSAQFATNEALYATTLLANQDNWSQPILISDPNNSLTSTAIAADAKGNATIVWGETIDDSHQVLRATTLPLNGLPTFLTDLTSRTVNNTSLSDISVAVDSFGNAVAIWIITIGANSYVQSASKPVCQGWNDAEILFSGNSQDAFIVLSDQGTAVGIWIDPVTGRVMGSRNAFLFPLTPPCCLTSRVCKNQFLTQKNSSLNLSWHGSPAPNIVAYQIFKNGQLIATLPGNVFCKLFKGLASACLCGNYSVVAVASNGNQSTPVILTQGNR